MRKGHCGWIDLQVTVENDDECYSRIRGAAFVGLSIYRAALDAAVKRATELGLVGVVLEIRNKRW